MTAPDQSSGDTNVTVEGDASVSTGQSAEPTESAESAEGESSDGE